MLYSFVVKLAVLEHSPIGQNSARGCHLIAPTGWRRKRPQPRGLLSRLSPGVSASPRPRTMVSSRWRRH